jgi:ABC-type branched-subunit amino acid transport system permease subunit
MSEFTAAIIGGLSLGAVYSLVTIGVVLIFRATETFNFAHGSFMLLAALIVGRMQSNSGLPFAILAVISLGIVGVVGALLFRFALRATVGRPHFVAVIATLGFAAVADGIIGIVFPRTQYTITIPGLSTGRTTIFGATFGTASLEISAFAVIVTVALVLVFRFTSLGVQVRAAGQNSLLASQGGINIHWVYLGSWALACVLAGIAGITYGSVNSVNQGIEDLALLAFPAALLGGLDSIPGSLIGGFGIGLVGGFIAAYVGGEYVTVVTYLVLLVVMLFLPHGIAGTRSVRRVLGMSRAITGTRSARPARAFGWRSLITQKYLIIVIALIVVAYFTANGSSYSIFIVDTILLSAIGAMALDLLMGTGGQVSIGNAAFLAGGSFATVWASRAGVPFPVDVIVGGVVCSAAGLAVGLPALRIRGMYLALATLAAFYLAYFIGLKYQDNAVGAAGFFLKPVFTGTIGQQSASWAWLLLGVVVATMIGVSWLRGGRSGRAWRMIRDHEIAASMMGIPVARYKLALFAISSGIIGIQGGLTAHFNGVVTYDSFTLSLSISVIAMILIGGLDSQAGPLIGAVVVTTMPIFVPDVINAFASSANASQDASKYSEVVYGLLIMFFMIKAPKGLVGLLAVLSRRALPLRGGSGTSPATEQSTAKSVSVSIGSREP